MGWIVIWTNVQSVASEKPRVNGQQLQQLWRDAGREVLFLKFVFDRHLEDLHQQFTLVLRRLVDGPNICNFATVPNTCRSVVSLLCQTERVVLKRLKIKSAGSNGWFEEIIYEFDLVYSQKQPFAAA